MRNAGVTKTDVTKTGGTAITATDVNGKTSASPLQIEDTANFFKAKADGGSNLVEFKLTANYTDSSGAPKSQDLALNTDNEYITADGEGYQGGNTYQIIKKSTSYSKLYWGADGGEDANKLIFEIPIELPEQVGQDDIKSFAVSIPYMNEDYIIDGLVENLDASAQSKGITYTLNSEDKTAAVASSESTITEAIIPKYVKDTNGNKYVVTSIGNSAFNGCSDLTSVEIPDSVTTIGKNAFCYCGALKSVEIGSGVTSISEGVFYECRALTSVEIPDSVTSIGVKAFNGCNDLKSVEIPDSVTSIDSMAFNGCSALTSVEIPNSVTSIGYAAFSSSGLTSVTIPGSVTSIGNSAFKDCSSLASVEIGNGVTTIGNNAFSSSGLTSVTIPGSVTSIGDSAFYCCSALTSVEIGNGVTSIGWGAFYYCNALTSVEIGNGVTSIEANAFSLCSSLNSITIKSTELSSVGKLAFTYKNSNKDLPLPQKITFYVPTGQVDNYKAKIANGAGDGGSWPSHWAMIEMSE